MRIISMHPKLSDFWAEHPDSEGWLRAWHQFAGHVDWRNFADVRRDYPHADAVAPFVVFNVCGNKYRLAVRVSYNKGKVYIHRVMTHKEYDRGDWKSE